MSIEQPWSNQQTRRVPAWVMSATLHAVVILLVGFLWKSAQPAASGASETSRTAGIMVAVQTDGETEYFDESNSTTPTNQTTAVSGASPASPADALPAVDQVPQLPDIALPGAVKGTVAGNLLDSPNLGMQGGAGLPTGDLDAEVQRIREQEAANRPPPPIGTPAALQVFGAPAVGRSFVFVIDRSKSMGGSGLGALLAAQTELLKGLATLSPSQRFEIVAYHQAPVTFGQTHYERSGLVKVTKESQAEAKKFFEGLVAFGSTKHEYAIFAALDMKPEVIFLLTDGGDPYPSPQQMKSMAGQAKRQGTVIHCVQFGLGPQQDDNNFMMKLSRQTNGVYRYHRMNRR